MKKRMVCIFILLTALVLILWSPALKTLLNYSPKGAYASSTYSKYCYTKEKIDGNIRKPLYYKTLDECGKPLKS